MKVCKQCGKEYEHEVDACVECGYVEKTLESKRANKGSVVWCICSAISFIASCIMIYKGYDKMTNYYNSDYSAFSTNAYVSGDAYNYIINGTYATSFFVLASMFSIMGVGFVICYYQSKKER